MNKHEKYFLLLGFALQFLFFSSIAIPEKFFFVSILLILFNYFNNLFLIILISFLFDFSINLPIGSSAILLLIYQFFINLISKYFHFRGFSNKLITCLIYFLIVLIYFYLLNPQVEIYFSANLVSFLYFVIYLFIINRYD